MAPPTSNPGYATGSSEEGVPGTDKKKETRVYCLPGELFHHGLEQSNVLYLKTSPECWDLQNKDLQVYTRRQLSCLTILWVLTYL